MYTRRKTELKLNEAQKKIGDIINKGSLSSNEYNQLLIVNSLLIGIMKVGRPDL